MLCEYNTDDQGALRHYCGVSLGLALQMATVLLSACIERMLLIDTPTLSCVPGEEVRKGACHPDSITLGGREIAVLSEGVQLLDYLVVVLPAVRILYDWFLCQNDLYRKCLQGIKQTIL